ncbi:MAG TPA: M20/M25/M40 family metallo-hydrolase, partial [Egibacteraceae bacterium]|nr:M20/M25/M40 family metallo-hydrolase [Egibacteraceae bacterium]
MTTLNAAHGELADVAQAMESRMALHRADLEALVRIPSVSAPGFDADVLRRSAEAVRQLLADRGFAGARLLEAPGAHPAVYAELLAAGPDAPTVMLYAHHDVQPPGDPAEWDSPAFSPHEREGRLYGRGAADDKAGILVHVAAVDAWLQARHRIPVNVKVFIEGEEETGSEHLTEFLGAHSELLACDALVITDSVNWKIGVPAITVTLRGLVDAVVEVRALDHALHSGMYGGPVPDVLSGLAKLLAAMTDEHGAVAIPGFSDDVVEPTAVQRDAIAGLDFDEESFRAEAGLLDGVELAGERGRGLLERLWLRPVVTVIGIDAPSVAGSSNTLAPTARARVSVRLGPGQDPVRARRLLCEWLESNAPWGLRA